MKETYPQPIGHTQPKNFQMANDMARAMIDNLTPEECVEAINTIKERLRGHWELTVAAQEQALEETKRKAAPVLENF